MFQKTAIALSQPALPKTSLTIGQHGYLNDRYYQTSYNTNYNDPNTKVPQLAKDPRISAIKFGDEQVDYNTETISKYSNLYISYVQPQKMEQFKLDKNQIRDLRQHHFDLGTEITEYP